jgi:peroxiredoxin (alkyl hydroperoxide reductase subunit C)
MATLGPPPPAKGIRAPGLKPGAVAPPFDLPASPDCRSISLEQLRGSPLLLIFYPADFTPVCGSELSIFNELQSELEALGAHVVGISVDSVYSHLAFARDLNLKIPLLADFHPKADVARRYRVYREDDGFCERALFVIDGGGTVFWSTISPIEVSPAPDGAIDALERLSGRRLGEPSSQEPLPEASP